MTRALRLLVNVRRAKAAIERLLEDEHFPEDRALSRALDRLQLLDEQARDVIAKIAATRRSA